jgi:hypothetical protein
MVTEISDVPALVALPIRPIHFSAGCSGRILERQTNCRMESGRRQAGIERFALGKDRDADYKQVRE